MVPTFRDILGQVVSHTCYLSLRLAVLRGNSGLPVCTKSKACHGEQCQQGRIFWGRNVRVVCGRIAQPKCARTKLSGQRNICICTYIHNFKAKLCTSLTESSNIEVWLEQASLTESADAAVHITDPLKLSPEKRRLQDGQLRCFLFSRHLGPALLSTIMSLKSTLRDPIHQTALVGWHVVNGTAESG